MATSARTGELVEVKNLKDFFRTSIEQTASKQRVDIQPAATHYVVNLLTLYSRSEALFEHDGEHFGLKPLALMLADASDADSAEARAQSLQRLGDVALFMSGFFIDGLADAAVDVDYYIHMGENAYGSLSNEIRGTFRGNAFSPIYRELADKFQPLVDILNEVRDGGSLSASDLTRIYEIWRKTGSQRALQQLRDHGIEPLGIQPRHH
ncbi:MAG: hypothetical protein AAFN07_16465 [Pseudomonadota bacterium]